MMTYWMVEDCRPYNMAKDKGLKNFAETFLKLGAKHGENVDVEDLISHPTTIARNVDQIYYSKQQLMKVDVTTLKIEEYGLTTDLWTDNYLKMSYLSLTIHYIFEGKLYKKLLALQSMDGEHQYNATILRKIEKALSDFDCSLNKAIIVTDRGSNMVAAFKNHTHLNCINHLINNTVEKSIKESAVINDMCDKCIKLVAYFKKSGGNIMLETSLKSFCQTRWNTMFYVLESVEKNWATISDILAERNMLYRISGIDIYLLKNTTTVLKHFEKASKKLEGDMYPTLHLTLVHVNFLHRMCQIASNDPNAIHILKNSFKKHLEKIVNKNLSIYHKIAMYLFPPTNKLAFFFSCNSSLTAICD